MYILSLVGSKYSVVFIDDFFKKYFIYFMRSKDKTFDKFQEFKAKVKAKNKKQNFNPINKHGYKISKPHICKFLESQWFKEITYNSNYILIE